MTTSIRSVRLIAFDSNRLNTLSSERGEIFFDQTNGTLRFFDTRTGDGQLIATRAWVQSNPIGIPSQTGNSGKVLTTNGSTISWVTPAVNYTLPTATLSTLGGIIGKVGYDIALGINAGAGQTPGNVSVAIGANSGNLTQGLGAVAVGNRSGKTRQGQQAVAIGDGAALEDQGDYAIAVGRSAGSSFQSARTIILNATGSVLNGVDSQPDSFYVAPIRTDSTPSNLLYYNTTTKEVTYGSAPVSYSLPTASTTVLGGVKVDGSTITINNGVISGAETLSTITARGYTTNTAVSFLGGATIGYADGLTILGQSGTSVILKALSAAGAGTTITFPATAGTVALTSQIPTDNNQLTNGAGYITTNGIPTQTGNTGKYLTTNGSTLSWGTVTAYSLPTASNTVLGGVKVDASSITIDGSGVISVPAVATIGVTNGIAQLGSDGKLVASQIPSSLSGAIIFKGTWNASTNTPTLADGAGTNGWEYAVSVGGSRNLGSGNINFVAGDYVIYNGTIWQQVPSSTIAAAGTLTGTTLNATVVASSLTSVGTLTDLTVTNTITGSITGNAGTVTNGVVTTSTYANPSWITSLAASKVGLANVTNESKSTMFSSPTFTGTVSGVTATHVGLGNVTNESKATMFASPTFTGTVSGVTATHVGLGNVTNESKATMFASPTFTGTVSGVTKAHVGLDSVENTALSTWAGSTNITTLGTITSGSAPASFVGLGNVTNESKATMFASPTFTGTVASFTVNNSILASTTVAGANFNLFSNLTGFQSLTIAGGNLTTGTDKYIYIGTGTNDPTSTTEIQIGSNTSGSLTKIWSPLTVVGNIGASNFSGSSSGTNTGDQTIPTTLPASDVYAWAKATTKPSYTATEVGLGNVTNESKATMFASPTFTGSVSGISAFMIASLKYAKIEFAVTNVANAGYRLNYPDYSTSNNPTVWVTAGETIAFNLNGISGSHPFLIQVNSGGTWSNYDLGLVHVGLAPTGTVSTGTNAQGKSTGMLYWTPPPDIAPGDYRYICSLHFNMVGTIKVKGADQNITSIRSTTPGNVDFGTSWGTVNSTYYKWDIPAAGTYLVWGTFRARTWGTSGFAKVRLYNQTSTTVVTDSDTMLIENQNTLSLNIMCTANWRYVATGACTLVLQGQATVGTGCGIQSDSNGYNECGFIRIT